MKNTLLATLLCSFLLYSCGGDDDSNRPLVAPNLVFPEENSECTRGIEVSDTHTSVTFIWNAANNADSYELTVTNLSSGFTHEFVTRETQHAVTLLKGEAYSWSVTSLSGGGSLTAQSEIWRFYNAGDGTVSYAPFPASIMAPNSGLKFSDTNTINLVWSGSDVDNDIAGYDVYLDDVNPPVTIIRLNVQQQSTTISSLNTGIYYWKIITRDTEGNTSDSGVYQFQIE